MFNAIKKNISKYTGLLIRIDDVAENMNWKLMNRCELLFDECCKRNFNSLHESIDY